MLIYLVKVGRYSGKLQKPLRIESQRCDLNSERLGGKWGHLDNNGQTTSLMRTLSLRGLEKLNWWPGKQDHVKIKQTLLKSQNTRRQGVNNDSSTEWMTKKLRMLISSTLFSNQKPNLGYWHLKISLVT